MYHYAARGNMHKKIGEDWTCSSEDTLITILHSPVGRQSNNNYL